MPRTKKVVKKPTKTTEKATKKQVYSNEGVKVLHGLEAIRQKSDMYIGGRGGGTVHLLKEVLDNSSDEFLNGYADKVVIEYFSDKNLFRVTDNGRGMPIDWHKAENKPTLEVLLTNIHASGKFDKSNYSSSAGKNGVGLKAVNALSTFFKVRSYTDKKFYQTETAIGSIEFSRGKVTEEFTKTKNDTGFHGTVVEWIADEKVFKEFAKPDLQMIRDIIDIRTYCCPGLKIIFDVDGKKETYLHKNGLIDYIKERVKSPLCEPHKFTFEEEATEGKNIYEIIFQFGNSDEDVITSFVNGIKVSGGTHETGFKTALTNTFNKYIKNNGMLPKELKEISADDIRCGFYCTINIRHTEPEFYGQTKDQLSNPSLQGLFVKQTNSEVAAWLDKNKQAAKNICNRIIKLAKARNNAKKNIEKIISTGSSTLNFSRKYVDCVTNDPDIKEVFICEGDSAANNLIMCRDPEFQGVFSLRGKPLNIYGKSVAEILKNKEMNELTLILYQTNDFKKFNIDNITTKHIIIASDADIDGLHIRGIMINNLWRIDPEILIRGYVYIFLSPKYRAVINNKNVFFNDDAELCDYRFNQIKKSIKVKNLKKILSIEDDFMVECNKIINRFNLHVDIFNQILSSLDEDYDWWEDMGSEFDYDDKTDRYSGLHDDSWQDFCVTDVDDAFKELREKFSHVPFNIEATIEDEDYDLNLYEFFDFIKDNFKLRLYYLKGLGECSEDVFQEFMSMENRRLLQVKGNSIEEIEDTLNKFFNPNTPNARKQFIIDSIEEGERYEENEEGD